MGAIPNTPGEGVKVLNALKDAGVSLAGFLAYRRSAKVAEVVLVVAANAPSPAKVVKPAGLALGKKEKGFLLTGEDRVGALAETLGKLAAAGISVVKTNAVCGGAGRFGALIGVEAKDLRKAAKALA
jgi:prephenate dehydratase